MKATHVMKAAAVLEVRDELQRLRSLLVGNPSLMLCISGAEKPADGVELMMLTGVDNRAGRHMLDVAIEEHNQILEGLGVTEFQSTSAL